MRGKKKRTIHGALRVLALGKRKRSELLLNNLGYPMGDI